MVTKMILSILNFKLEAVHWLTDSNITFDYNQSLSLCGDKILEYLVAMSYQISDDQLQP